MPCVDPRLHTSDEDRDRLMAPFVGDIKGNAETTEQKRGTDGIAAIIGAIIRKGSQFLGCQVVHVQFHDATACIAIPLAVAAASASDGAINQRWINGEVRSPGTAQSAEYIITPFE
jgi:hypothetical protein